MPELELREISNGRKNDLDWIRKQVGKPYSFFQNLRMGGSGSPRLKYITGSSALNEALLKVNSSDYCNIELLPNGILLRMNVNTLVYAMPIAFKLLGSIEIIQQEDVHWPAILKLEIINYNTLYFNIKKERFNAAIAFFSRPFFQGRLRFIRL